MKNKLKKGEYRAVVKCSNILEAASNGLISVFPAQNYIDMPFMRVHGIYFIQCEFANQKIMVKSFIE